MHSVSIPEDRLGEFRIVGKMPSALHVNPYRAALDFVHGRFWVEGDLPAAVRAYTTQARPALASWLSGGLGRLSEMPPIAWLEAARSARDIRFHYDRSNEFFRQFLDSRMVYSCAYFRNANQSLEHAQAAKLDLICRKLDLPPGARLLDIGSGWGALLIHAAEQYGSFAVGCTLSPQQASHTNQIILERHLQERVTVFESDYRDMQGTYDRIVSVGMFEHVGRAHLRNYFSKLRTLLKRDGLFLNHGIVRRQGVAPDLGSLFVQRNVFPGTALVYLSDVIREAELSGFEVLDVENIRPHYALTCRAWVERLQANADACRQLVDEETYRTWLIYLAGSAVNFEDGDLDVHQVLLARRGSRMRPLTRDYIFADRATPDPQSGIRRP